MRKHVLLNLPLPNINSHFKGISIGKTKDFPSTHLLLSRDDFLRHALIAGSTGSGKTTTASQLASELAREGKVLVLDWFGEYPAILAGAERLVPSAETPLPLSIEGGVNLIDILEEVLELTPPQVFVLMKAIKGKSVSSLRELVRFVERLRSDSKWFLESKLALLRKLESLKGSGSEERFSSEGVSEFVNMLKSVENPIIIDLSGFRVSMQKKLAALLTLKLIESLKSKGLIGGNIYVVIEEAQNLVSLGESLLQRLHAEVRKEGIGLIMISQSPSMLPKGVLANTNVKIYHTLKLRDDLEVACRSLGQELRECAAILTRLRVGEAIVDAPELPHPFQIEVFG